MACLSSILTQTHWGGDREVSIDAGSAGLRVGKHHLATVFAEMATSQSAASVSALAPALLFRQSFAEPHFAVIDVAEIPGPVEERRDRILRFDALPVLAV